MSKVRYGIIGIGNMGIKHAELLNEGQIDGAELTAVCVSKPSKIDWVKQKFGDGLHIFADEDEFLASGTFDALIIATPHYQHPETAVKAFENGLHVLVEKPVGVYTKQVREMNEAAAASGKKFSMMFNQRTYPIYQKLRDLVSTGELGEIKRVNWIKTNWYRSQSYYDSGSWRATWAQEGGGVLINQCPHNLDLLYWTLGMVPARIRAFCHFGKHRNIEVEDDVTAYMEYDNGATGVFITSVADAPGTNRLEVTGDRGKIVIENGQMNFWRLRELESDFNRNYQGGFGEPEYWECKVPIDGIIKEHEGIIQNFTDSILNGTSLLAPGEEGIHGLMLSNAMHLSTWMDDWVSLPIDEDLYHEKLQEKQKNSVIKKNVESKLLDVSGTHS